MTAQQYRARCCKQARASSYSGERKIKMATMPCNSASSNSSSRSACNKPLTGHFKKAGVAPMRYVREVRLADSKDETKPGDRVLVDGFKIGEFVDVTGVSKGKGFAGGVKRWHYRGGEGSHGSMFHRAPGGIGASSFPSRVWKGQHFPGHMGNERVTSKNLRVVKIDTDENLLLVRGAVPGPAGSYIFINKAKTAK